MNKIIVINHCDNCPIRRNQESHGPSDSAYWQECGITGVIIDGFDASERQKAWKKTGKFPTECPLKDTKQKPTTFIKAI